MFSILLSNTCHPERAKQDNETLRNTFHAGVARVFYPDRSNCHTGLDRLSRERFHILRNTRRAALLTNHAAIDQMGRHILDVFDLGPSYKLHALYSPEHGIRGAHEAGAHVGPEHSEMPVISLYGKRKRPSKAELEEIDLFIVDLQDIGSRYYTYMSTMKDCMAACAEAKKTVLVLDRPNPLGGNVLEGPIARKTGAPVCCSAIPIRHGMTMGELALHFMGGDLAGNNPNIVVHELDGWRGDLMFDDCALPWLAPSPNIPAPMTALIYVGACLFEGVNMNEGRGTATPFHIVGAPWLDTEAIAAELGPRDLPGCSLSVCEYTPRSIPGKAANPAYRDKQCNGIRIHIDNPSETRAFTVAYSLLSAIHKRHHRRLEWNPMFDTLAGGPMVREWIERCVPVPEMLGMIEPELAKFDRERPRQYA